MAEPQGILAILAGKKKPSDESDDGEPSSRKARAVRDMFRAAKDEDWEACAEAFHRAYVDCKMQGKEEAEGREDDEDAAEDLDDYEG